MNEAAEMFPQAAWEKSFTSGDDHQGGGCVDVNMALKEDDMVGVRHRKHPELGAFVFNQNEWGAFIAAVKAGQFDL